MSLRRVSPAFFAFGLVSSFVACGGEVEVLLSAEDASVTDSNDGAVARDGSGWGDAQSADVPELDDSGEGARDANTSDSAGPDAAPLPDSGDGDVADGGPRDAVTADGDGDAGMPDATLDAADATTSADGAVTDVASDAEDDIGEPDVVDPIGTPCSVRGESGECLPTAECDDGRVSTPGLCPGPADIQCCTVEPEEPDPTECSEDDFPTPNEGLMEIAYDAECPAGMIRVSDFCIDRYEAFVVEVLDDGTTVPWSPYFNPGDRRIRALSVEGAIPQGYITGLQAEAACAEAGKRLCSNEEWLRACQGAAASTYPYGDSRLPGVCNDARPMHPVVEWFGTSADWIWSRLDHPCISQQSDTVDAAGSNVGCVSADGAFDMMGNLHEWTSDPSGTFRGGFYTDTVVNGPGCLYRTTAHNRYHWDYSTGFRCCAD